MSGGGAFGTLAELLNEARAELGRAGVEVPDRTARWLWETATGQTRARVILAQHEPVARPDRERFLRLVQRRAAREPLQYIVGEAEFCGLSLTVDHRVLIPRPETERLAREAARATVTRAQALGRQGDGARSEQPVREDRQQVVFVDLGVGSGAILLTVAVAARAAGVLERCRLIGTDYSADALAVAQANASRLGLSFAVDFYEGDFALAIPDNVGLIDVCASNPPYVAMAEADSLQPEVGLYEPAAALFGGVDGLDAYRELIPGLWPRLAPDGLLLLEVGLGQAEAVKGLIAASGEAMGVGATVNVFPDERGIPRVVAASPIAG